MKKIFALLTAALLATVLVGPATAQENDASIMQLHSIPDTDVVSRCATMV